MENIIFNCVFVDITEEKLLQDRVREVYEKELAYFADMSLNGGSIQGRMNVTQNVVENYVASEEAGVTEIGRSYQYTIEKVQSQHQIPSTAIKSEKKCGGKKL